MVNIERIHMMSVAVPKQKKEAILVLQTNPVGGEPFFFCSINLHSH